MKRKIILTFLATSLMLVAIVTAPLLFHDQEHSYQPSHHGEM